MKKVKDNLLKTNRRVQPTKKNVGKKKTLSKKSINDANDFSLKTEEENEEFGENSDSEMDEELSESSSLSVDQIRKWEKEFDSKKNITANFKNVSKALKTVVESMESDDSRGKTPKKSSSSKIAPKVFNALVCICLKKIPIALHSLFEIKTSSDKPTKNKKWVKLSGNIRNYLNYLNLLLKSMTESENVAMILKKGILPLLPFYAEFIPVSWKLTRIVATLWCTSSEKVRVLSTIALMRLFNSFKDNHREKQLKLLYISYVNNCRFTSPSTWPLIDFMRLSLVELYSMDEAIAYRHAFVYIRQLVFHLRNAMLVQTKERLQMVYNWQFIHCIHFWADLLANTHPSTILQPLIYPLTQTANGVLTLMKSPKYFPITFHVCNILTELSHKTGTFIPVLPFIVEVFSCHRLFSKPKTTSLKPLEWKCIIKVSDSQLSESSFTDGLIEEIFESILKYLNTRCSSIAFPELVFPLIIQVKSFLKKCRVPSYSKKIKQLLDKINENVKFINERRKSVPFAITDSEAIKNWEIECDQSNPPIRLLFDHCKSVQAAVRQGEIPADGIDEFSISSVRKRQRMENSSDEEDAQNAKILPKKGKKERQGQKCEEKDSKEERKIKATEEDDKGSQDIVKEMKLSDFEEESSEENDDGSDSENEEEEDENDNVNEEEEDENDNVNEGETDENDNVSEEVEDENDNVSEEEEDASDNTNEEEDGSDNANENESDSEGEEMDDEEDDSSD